MIIASSAALLGAGAAALALSASAPVNTTDRAVIEKIVREYILTHPEILPEAMENLRGKEMAKVIEANRTALETPIGDAWDGAADADVGEGLAGRFVALDVAVHADEGGREVGVQPELLRPGLAQLDDLGRGDGAGDVQLAAAEGALLGEELGDRAELHGLQADVGGVPVAGVAPHHDAPGDLPGLERERAVADHGAGARPKRVE